MLNPGEWNTFISWAAAIVIPIFVRWGMTSDQASAVVTTLGSALPVIGLGVWQIYSHWNMRKVPEKAVVTAIAPTVADAKAASIPAAK